MAYGITGVFKLMQGVQESLAGRVAVLHTYIPVTGRDIRRNDETVYGRSGGFKREQKEREQADTREIFERDLSRLHACDRKRY